MTYSPIISAAGAAPDSAAAPVSSGAAAAGAAPALTGQAGTDHRHVGASLEPLFEAIVDRIPSPDVDADAPAQLLVTTTSYDDYKGRIAVGRLQQLVAMAVETRRENVAIGLVVINDQNARRTVHGVTVGTHAPWRAVGAGYRAWSRRHRNPPSEPSLHRRSMHKT